MVFGKPTTDEVVVVVFETNATKQRHETTPYEFGSALEVRCLCGNLVHSFEGAQCRGCGATVVEVRHVISEKSESSRTAETG